MRTPKKLLLSFVIFIALFAHLTVNAQTEIRLGNTTFPTSGATVITCNSTFFDSGGSNGDYGNNENYWGIIRPADALSVIRISFNQLNLGAGDTLFFYSGPDTVMSPRILTLTAGQNMGPTSSAIIVIGSNITGSLSFRFVSNGANVGSGWIAQVECARPCQTINASFATTPMINNGIVSACANDTIKLKLNLSFPQNGNQYTQRVDLCRISWDFGGLGNNVNAMGLDSVTRVITQPGQGFNVLVTVQDSNGCTTTTPLRLKLRTSPRPTFGITPVNLCVGDTALITSRNSSGSVTFNQPSGTFTPPPIAGSYVFLPDVASGSNVVYYYDTINVSSFLPGATVNSGDFVGVFMNMEHSFLGDLSMHLIAPNGTEVTMLPYTNSGGGRFLGEPVDDETLPQIPGRGYTYGFSISPQFNVRLDQGAAPTRTFIDNSGTSRTNAIVDSGTYASANSFNAFNGSPLNGNWVLKIGDHQRIDNGYIFTWGLKFNPNLATGTEDYRVGIASARWLPAVGQVYNSNDSIRVSFSTAGSYDYTFRLIDSAGCVFDTVVNMLAYPIPVKPNAGPDTTICSDQTITLQVMNPQNVTNYSWNNGAIGTQVNISIPGTYTVLAENSFGCRNRDTVIVALENTIAVSLGNDTLFCKTSPNVLRPQLQGPLVQFLWNTGATTQNLPITDSGTYWVQARTVTGCKVYDTIRVGLNPVNFYQMPNDTAICDGYVHTIRVNLPAPGTTITWYDGSTGVTHTAASQGYYRSVANFIGCFNADSTLISIKPLPIISLGRDTTLCNGFEVTKRVSYPGASYQWNTGAVDSFYTINKQALYWVEAELNRCTFRDSIQVNFVDCSCDFKIPNAFSPNGDGINDIFKPDLKCFPKQYRFSIFNRYGQQVFETRDSQSGWNGTQGGKNVAVATYYYIVEYYNEALRKTEKYSGSVTLLR
ncbi:MAG: gliding motility-associated C-terminal domain-containing protein [Chitinophagaceae bacterium]